jgi:hypothetical protein
MDALKFSIYHLTSRIHCSFYFSNFEFGNSGFVEIFENELKYIIHTLLKDFESDYKIRKQTVTRRHSI